MAYENRHLTKEQLSAFLDGHLSSTERAHVDAHLKTCMQCQQDVADVRQTVALLRALPPPQLPRSFMLPTDGQVIPAQARRDRPTAVTSSGSRGSRAWPRSVRHVVRVASVLAAVASLLLLLSNVFVGGTSGTGGSTVPPSGSSPTQQKALVPGPETVQGEQTSPTPLPSTMPPGLNHAKIQAPDQHQQAQSAPPRDAPRSSSWDMSTPMGRNLLGIVLLLLSGGGFLFLWLQRKRQRA